MTVKQTKVLRFRRLEAWNPIHIGGEEWGTGWVFPHAGCWTIVVTRTSGSGYLVLRVADPVGR